METLVQVWSDEHGYRWEVGPDRDGGDQVELRYYEAKSDVADTCITMPVAVWNKLSGYAHEMESFEE